MDNLADDIRICVTSTNPVGFPTGIGGNSCLIIQQGNRDYRAQFAFSFGSGRIAIRQKYGTDTWGEWKYSALQSEIDTINSDLSSKIFVENHTLSFIDGKCDISGGNHFIVSVTPIGTEITASIVLVDLPNTYRVILSNSTWNNELACQITYTAKG